MNHKQKIHWRRKRNPSTQAVTLIELLVVVAIIAILAALLIPMTNSMQEKARQASCLAHMKEMAGIISQYSAENDNRILPAVSGNNANMNDEAWYEELDEKGYLPGSPHATAGLNQATVWSMRSIMACPARENPPSPYWVGGRHALHFTANQHPGFFNRVNTAAGAWPTLARIAKPSRTFLLAESSFFVAYPDGENLVYPHPKKGRTPEEGNGMNLVFYDGHAEFFKGRLPVLPGGDFSVINYEQLSPEDSFPWY